TADPKYKVCVASRAPLRVTLTPDASAVPASVSWNTSAKMPVASDGPLHPAVVDGLTTNASTSRLAPFGIAVVVPPAALVRPVGPGSAMSSTPSAITGAAAGWLTSGIRNRPQSSMYTVPVVSAPPAPADCANATAS